MSDTVCVNDSDTSLSSVTFIGRPLLSCDSAPFITVPLPCTGTPSRAYGGNFFFLTMFRQQSQYDSRLRFSSRVLVRVSVMVRLGLGLELVIWLGLWLGLRVRVRVRVRVGFMVMVRVGVRVRIMVNLTLTLTKTLELNLNRLSYWDCCRNMVRKKKFAYGGPRPSSDFNFIFSPQLAHSMSRVLQFGLNFL